MFSSLFNIVEDVVKIAALPVTFACTVMEPVVEVVEEVVEDLRETLEDQDVL